MMHSLTMCISSSLSGTLLILCITNARINYTLYRVSRGVLLVRWISGY